MPKHASHEPSAAPSDRPDDRIGLTEAFSPVPDDPQPSGRQGGKRGKDEEAGAPPRPGAHAGGFSYRGDSDDEFPNAIESLEPLDSPPLLFGEDSSAVKEPPRGGRHGKPPKRPVPAYQRKSRRMRRVLIVVILLLVVLIGALAYFSYRLFNESQTLASQQTQEQQSTQGGGALKKDQDDTKDAATATTKKTDVPNLASVLGMTQDQALAALKHGATVTVSKEVKEEGNPVKTNVTVALTDEPADTRSGTPTVYLGLGEDGKVVQAGYSAATASLGYGSLSFVDAVLNEHIVEKTLQEAGIPVTEGSAKLPTDKGAYSSYASDGTTLEKETYSFSGTVALSGSSHEWSSVLMYNYATANASGNLADTIRIIYVYINA